MFNERWRDGRKEVRKYVPRLRKQRISLAAIYPLQPHLIGVGVRDKDARRKQLCCESVMVSSLAGSASSNLSHADPNVPVRHRRPWSRPSQGRESRQKKRCARRYAPGVE
jgi:hypothetical protein